MQTWIIYALLAMLFAGITAILAKPGMKNIHADIGVAIRSGFVMLVVWANVFIFGYLKDGWSAKLTGKEWLLLAASGVTAALSWIFYFRAVKEGDVGVVATIDKASLLITVLFAFLVLKEPMTPKIIIGSLLVFSGMLVMVWK